MKSYLRSSVNNQHRSFGEVDLREEAHPEREIYNLPRPLLELRGEFPHARDDQVIVALDGRSAERTIPKAATRFVLIPVAVCNEGAR